MDRILNPRIEKQTIYEIYRACRLCGAGAGYKMPIIQNVVDLEGSEVELKQKIRECVQVEVTQDDKMPPLICELCVDKVNDFYEFLELCRQTNKRTRMRLGLPMQTMSKGSSSTDSGDCILGMTEPVYINEDSDGEPLAKHRAKTSKNTKKKVPEMEALSQYRDTRSSSVRLSRHKRVSPPRLTRTGRGSGHSDNVALSRLQGHGHLKVPPKSILKKEKDVKIKNENDSSLVSSRLKRIRDKDTSKPEVPVKKVKIAIKNTVSPKPSPKVSPKSRAGRGGRPSPPRPPGPPARPPAPTHPCTVCPQLCSTPQGFANHMRSHAVTFTNHKLACNACGMWFSTTDEVASHHRKHRQKANPYTCPRCKKHYKQLNSFDEHYNKNQCVPSVEVPDVKCEVCWRYYPTNKLYEEHKCGGEDSRRGGKCNKCSRTYSLLKNLKKHESICTARKKGEVNVDPKLLRSLKPLQVRVARCDPLLSNIKREHVDVSEVDHEYGLDRNCIYPYISYGSFRIKSEFSINQYDGMVNIEEGVKEEFCSASFVHWDSDDESDSDTEISGDQLPKKSIESLSTLTLKTIFSQKFLGKVPRKRRRVKTEKFDTNTDLYGDISKSIDSIIDNLGKDDDEVVCNDAGKTKDLSIDFDNLLSEDKDVGDGTEMDVGDMSKNDDEGSKNKENQDGEIVKGDDKETEANDASENVASAVSFDDLLKNDDEGSNNKENQDGEIVKGDEKETEVNDASENVASAVSFDDLLKNDDEGSNNKENQDGEIIKGDDQETEANNAAKNDGSSVSFDDLLKNDDAVSKPKEHKDDELIKGDEKETEVNDASKEDCNAVSFDDLLKKDDDQINDTNESVDEKVNNDVEMSEIDTNKVNDEIMETDDTPINDNKVELLNHENEKSEKSIDDEKNSEVVVNNDIYNEQTNVINDKVISEDISKDSKEMKLIETDVVDIVETRETDEDLSKMDISDNNISLEKTDNEVPISDAPLNDITKETNETTDFINDQQTRVQTKDSNDCPSIVNGEADPKSDELNNLDDVSDTEMDDTKLMEALDAQIGESNDKDLNNDCNEPQNDKSVKNERNECKNNDTKINESELNHVNAIEKDIDSKDINEKTDIESYSDGALVNDKSEAEINDRVVKSNNDNDKVVETDVKVNDKITLEDLIPTRQNPDLKSLDLDNISDDDFNFDM